MSSRALVVCGARPAELHDSRSLQSYVCVQFTNAITTLYR